MYKLPFDAREASFVFSTFKVACLALLLSACGGGGGGGDGASANDSLQTDGTVQPTDSSASTDNIQYNWPAHLIGYRIIFTVEGDSTSSPTGIPVGSEVIYDYNASGSVIGTNPVSGNVYTPDSYNFSSDKNVASISLRYSGGLATEKYVLTTTSATTGTYEYTGNAGDSRGDMYNWGRYVILGSGIGNQLYPAYTFVGDGASSIGGQVSGLTSGVALQTSDGRSITVSEDGNFSFPTTTTDGVTYAFSVQSHPAGQTCAVTDSSHLESIQINCTSNSVGGSISGLLGSIVLRDQAGNDVVVGAGESYSFTTAVNWGYEYAVTILAQPFGQNCTLSNTSGVFLSSVNNINISCVEDLTGPGVSVDYRDSSIVFSWDEMQGATHYQLLENPDGQSGFAQVGANLTGLSYQHDIPVHLLDWDNARYMVAACQADRCLYSSEIMVAGSSISAIDVDDINQSGVLDLRDDYGNPMVMSRDGTTMVVSAPAASSWPNLVANAGRVVVFVRDGDDWVQQEQLGASNAETGDYFGQALALSDDGNTLAVAAWSEQSNATGINGNQADNSADESGAVYIFKRSGTSWVQQAYIKASNTGVWDRFGSDVSLSADGNTLAVGAHLEKSSATGTDGAQNDNSANSAGAVYIFTATDGVWSQQAYLKASNTGADDYFGHKVVLSGDGNTLAVSAVREDSNGTQSDNSVADSGAVYVFSRFADPSASCPGWCQQAYLKASNPDSSDRFGQALDLSYDGSVLAVGAPYEASNATGIDGEQADNSSLYSGAVYTYARTESNWSQQAYVKALFFNDPYSGSNATNPPEHFGYYLSISADGNLLAVAAPYEDNAARGVNDDPDPAPDDPMYNSRGAVHIYQHDGVSWSGLSHVKGDRMSAESIIGPVALNADGSLMTILSESRGTVVVTY